jgi:hypothetical protein
LAIFFIAIIFFSDTFFLLGKNQADFGDLTEEQIESLPYSKFYTAMLYVS